MPRIARVVVPDIPHHVTQRGNRRQPVFFREQDYRLYLRLAAESCSRAGVSIWAYCLMPNHIHLIAVPSSSDGLREALGETHRRYTCHVNLRMKWTGYLWQGRFASFPMDEPHLLAAARYVELNPVKAGLVQRPEDYAWSSARAHLLGRDDDLVRCAPLLDRFPDWADVLRTGTSDAESRSIESHARTGRPLGGAAFIERLERITWRVLGPRKRGPKPRRHGVTVGI